MSEGPYDHIPLPVTPGAVLYYQSGWVFSVVGSCGNDYLIRTVTYDWAAQAKQKMRELVERLNAPPSPLLKPLMEAAAALDLAIGTGMLEHGYVADILRRDRDNALKAIAEAKGHTP